MDDIITRDILRKPDIQAIREAGKIIREGGLVAFPTETVYGLGGDALNPLSSERIYAAKGRPSDNPLIVHIADLKDLSKIVREIPDRALILARNFWPGPLTMIFHASDAVPLKTTGGLNTVAVRMPSDKTALSLIKEAGGYIAAPSANTSGRPSPTKAEHVAEDLGNRVSMILDGGSSVMGLESTIVDLTEDIPMILRPGFVTKEEMEKALGIEVIVDPAIVTGDYPKDGSGQRPKAPGMRYRHYAPKAEMVLVTGNKSFLSDYIHDNIKKASEKGIRTGIICCEESLGAYRDLDTHVICIGRSEDERTAAAAIYSALRDFDQMDISVIYSEGFPEKGIGMAIMNRLRKAAGGNVIEI